MLRTINFYFTNACFLLEFVDFWSRFSEKKRCPKKPQKSQNFQNFQKFSILDGHIFTSEQVLLDAVWAETQAYESLKFVLN